MRLIDADAFKIKGVPEESLEFDAGVIYALDCLANAPTIDAEPVRHGRWIPCTKKGMPITELGLRQGLKWYGFKCSECMAIYKGNALTESPYCQHCGARMEVVL